jgi:NAD(P)-dependent dehydrogenase (short-subunit alcohol dehydrogenase family)
MNRIDLSGRIALVGGGCGGIGQAVRQRFRDSGATVIIWDLPETADDRIDVTDESAVAGGIRSIISQFGRIDILYHQRLLNRRGNPLRSTRSSSKLVHRPSAAFTCAPTVKTP